MSCYRLPKNGHEKQLGASDTRYSHPMNRSQTEPWLTLPASVAWPYIDALYSLLKQAGFPVGQWLADAGVTAQPKDGDERLSLYHALSLWHRVERDAHTPLLGLKLGQALQPRDFPILGQAALSADTLRSAIQRLQEFEPLIWDIGLCHLEVTGQKAKLMLSPRHRTLLPAGIIELAISGWLQIGRKLLPEHQNATVSFTHQHSRRKVSTNSISIPTWLLANRLTG